MPVEDLGEPIPRPHSSNGKRAAPPPPSNGTGGTPTPPVHLVSALLVKERDLGKAEVTAVVRYMFADDDRIIAPPTRQPVKMAEGDRHLFGWQLVPELHRGVAVWVSVLLVDLDAPLLEDAADAVEDVGRVAGKVAAAGLRSWQRRDVLAAWEEWVQPTDWGQLYQVEGTGRSKARMTIKLGVGGSRS